MFNMDWFALALMQTAVERQRPVDTICYTDARNWLSNGSREERRDKMLAMQVAIKLRGLARMLRPN